MSRWLPAFLRPAVRKPIMNTPKLEVNLLEDRLAPAAFTPGNLLVLRVGDGIATFGSAGTATPSAVTSGAGAPVFLDEYTTAGALVQSIAVPTTTTGAQLRLVETIGTTTEGYMSLSGDGQYVAFAGYDSAPYQATSLAGTSTTGATPVPRVLGWAKYDGTLNTTTSVTAFTGANIRGVATNDGNQFWATGSSGTNTSGTRYFGTLGATGAAGVQVNNPTNVNMRGAYFFGGRLYWGTGSATGTTGGTTGLFTATAAVPTTAGVANGDTVVASSASGQPHQFQILDMDGDGTLNTGDRLYLADESTNLKSVTRYTYNGTTWATPTVLDSSQSSLRGLTGRVVNATTAELFATTASASVSATTASSSTSILTLTDDGTTPFPGTTKWASLSTPVSFVAPSSTAAAVQQFRGITFVPTAPTGVATTTTVTGVSPLTVNLGQSVTLNASVAAATGTNTPTGTVQFRNGSTIFGTVSVTGSGATGTATLNTSSIPAGTYGNITALFTPTNSSFVTSTSGPFAGTLQVNAFSTSTSLASNVPNPPIGTPVTFTATVSSPGNPTPTGAVDFYANGLKVASGVAVNGSGVATFTMSTNAVQVVANDKLTPGINHIEARFIGTGVYLNSATEAGQKVQPGTITVGDILVLRVGDGYNVPSVNGNRMYFDQYTTAGGQTAPVQSILLPTVQTGANKPVLGSGQQSQDTQVVASPDGKYLYFTAYQAVANNPLPLHTTASTTIPRVIGRLTLADGTIDTSMALTDVASATTFRSLAVAPDGAFYVGGGFLSGTPANSVGNGTLRLIPGGFNPATTTSTDLGITNIAFSNITIAGTTPQLYTATPQTTVANTQPKAGTVGTGLPTAPTPTVTTLLSGGNPDPYIDPGITPKTPQSLFFADLNPAVSYAGGVDTMYMTDIGGLGAFNAGTITKWSWKDTGGGVFAWVLNQAIPANTAGTQNVDNNFTHMTGTQSGSTVTLVVSNGSGGNPTSTTNPNNGGGALWTVTDTGGHDAAFSNNVPVELATLNGTNSNAAFRAAIRVPAPAVTTPTVTGFTVNNGAAQRSRITRIDLAFSGTVTAADFNTLGAIQLKRTAVANTPTGAVNDIVQTGPAAANHITVAQNGGTGLTLTFDNNGLFNTSNTGVQNGSLTDGYWQILAGSFSSTPGSLQLRRLYGDSTSEVNGSVNITDLAAFGNDFNSSAAAFDFNNDGVIGVADLTAFGNNFGNAL